MPEVVIVGGGIAGAAAAYFLAERGLTDVVLLERERQPGSQASGRSAASLVTVDPNPTLELLKRASAPFLRAPAAGFCDTPLLQPTGIMLLYDASPAPPRPCVRAELLTPAQAAARVPVLAPDRFGGAVFLPEDGHLDVHALLQSYLGGAARRGVELRCGVEVTGVRVERGRVRAVGTSDGELEARWVVDAAGAWAGVLAAQAGALPIAISPLRRCIATFAAPPGIDPTGWPLTAHDEH